MMDYSPTIMRKKKKNYSSDALSVISQTLSLSTLKETRSKLLSDFECFFPYDFPKRLETMDGELLNIFARELHSVRNLRNVEKTKMENDPVRLQKFELVQEIAKLESMKLRLAKANEKLVSDIRRIRRIADINKSFQFNGNQSAASAMRPFSRGRSSPRLDRYPSVLTNPQMRQ